MKFILVALALALLVGACAAQVPACVAVSGLKTCTGVNWSVVASVGNSASTYDDNVAAAVKALSGTSVSASCIAAYQEYMCDATFEECSSSNIPELVCQSDCNTYASECSVDGSFCSEFPTSSCTSGGGSK